MKRLISTLLSLTMLVSALPQFAFSAFAAENSLPDVYEMVMPTMTDDNSDIWYTFDDAIGTKTVENAAPSSSKKDSVELSGTFVPDGGAVKGALEFNGVSDYVKVNNDDKPSTGTLHGSYTAYSAAFWFKPKKLDGIQMLYIQGDPANETGVAIRLNGDKLEAAVSAKKADPTVMDVVDVSAYLNKWTHVALTFENGTAKLYVNARLESEKYVSANTIAAIYSGASIGKALFADGFGKTGDCGQYFNGLIDDYRVYKSAIVPKIKIQSYSGTDDIGVAKGTAIDSIGLPSQISANLTATESVELAVGNWSSRPEYNPNAEDTYVFSANAGIPDYLFAQTPAQIKVSVGNTDPELDAAIASARIAAEELTLRDDTTKEDILSAVRSAIGDKAAISNELFAVSESTADSQGYIKGIIDIKKSDITRSLQIDVILPKTGDVLGTVSLMSAARKNHYIRNNSSVADIYYDVAKADRSFTRKQGLADENGVSFKLAGTDNYLQVSGDKLIIAAATTEAQRRAATFYASDGERPGWALVYDGFFEKYATFANKDEYIKADISDNTLYIGSIDESDLQDRLSASFKKTADNTDVIEGLRGAVYYPSYSYNGPQFFKFYDSAIIERDMQYAQSLGINAFRIWVSYEYWLEDAEHFKKGYDDFLRLADKYGIKVLVSLFEGCSNDNDYNVRDYSVSYSVTSPTSAIYDNRARWNEPKAFIDWFMDNYKDDTRQMAIEVYNEPWGTRENLAAELLKYTIPKQGKVAVSLGTSPSGDGLHSIAYSVKEGVDIIQYHDNFPANTTNFTNNAKNKLDAAANYNLPLYCTEVQWVGGPGNPYDSHYENLAPTCNELSKTGKWAPFYWTLMVHPCYLPGNRQFKLTNGVFQEDGSVWSVASAAAIAPEADTSGLSENKADPYTQYYYSHTYSDNFMDNHGYKWTLDSTLSVENEQLVGTGTATADLTKFSNFKATVDVKSDSAGLLFRAKDKDNGLLAEISDGKLGLYKLANGHKTLVAANNVQAESSYTLSVTANGSKIKATAGEAEVTADVNDGDYSNGLIGLRADSEAVFDNLLVTANIGNSVPAAPENLLAVRTASGVQLLWSESAKADGYTVLRADKQDGDYTQIADNVKGTSYTDESAVGDNTYCYRVQAYNENGKSIVSNSAECKKAPTSGPAIKMPAFDSTNGLLWYKFDEPQGSNKVSSSVVRSTSAALSGTLLPTGGKTDGAMLFDGSDDYVQINAADTNTGLLHDGFTKRSFSFYMCPFTLSGKQMLMKIGGDINGVALRINDGALEAAVAHGAANNSSTQYLSERVPLTDEYINRWTHVAVVFDEGELSIYLDGELVSQGKVNGTSIASASRAAYIGACGDGVSAFRDAVEMQRYNGLIDDFKVYKTAAVPAVVAGEAKQVTATPGAGKIKSGTEITLSTETKGAYIMYSLNGGKTWTKYSSPIKITSFPTMIKAYAEADNMTASAVTEFVYTLDESGSLKPPAPKPTPTPSVPKNGVLKVNGKTVLYKNSKAVTGTKVVTVGSKTYAVVKGYVKTGKGNRLVNIGKKTYIVNKNGIVQKGAKNKLVKVGKKSYIVNKQGVVQKNKKSIKVGKKVYKTNKKGVATKKK